MPVAVTCRVLKLHRRHYYAWLVQPVTAAELDETTWRTRSFDADRDHPEFGDRFLADEVHDAGFGAAERVWRICSDNGWWSVFARRSPLSAASSARPLTATGRVNNVPSPVLSR